MRNGSVGHFSHQVDFNRGTCWKCVDAHRRAGMATLVAKHGNEQVRASVDHLGLIGERVGAIHEAPDAHDALDLAQIAHLDLERGQKLQRTGAGRRGGLRLGDLPAHFADQEFSVRSARDLTGKEDEIARADRRNVVRDGRGGRGQTEPKLSQACFGRWRRHAADHGRKEEGGKSHKRSFHGIPTAMADRAGRRNDRTRFP